VWDLLDRTGHGDRELRRRRRESWRRWRRGRWKGAHLGGQDKRRHLPLAMPLSPHAFHACRRSVGVPCRSQIPSGDNASRGTNCSVACSRARLGRRSAMSVWRSAAGPTVARQGSRCARPARRLAALTGAGSARHFGRQALKAFCERRRSQTGKRIEVQRKLAAFCGSRSHATLAPWHSVTGRVRDVLRRSALRPTISTTTRTLLFANRLARRDGPRSSSRPCGS